MSLAHGALEGIFFNETATTEIYTRCIVGSVRCVLESAPFAGLAGRALPLRLLLPSPISGAGGRRGGVGGPVPYTHLRPHETLRYFVCRLLLEQKKRRWPPCS